jgi:hypothetical protein
MSPSCSAPHPFGRRTLQVGVALAFCFLSGCATLPPKRTPAAPAIAVHARDPLCVGDCLNGKDPFESGCAADARSARRTHVVTDDGTVIGIVELRVSPACGTAWARILRTEESHVRGILGGVTVDNGASWLSYRVSDAVSLWTDMHVVPVHGCATASGVLFDTAGHALAEETRASDCAPQGGSLASR